MDSPYETMRRWDATLPYSPSVCTIVNFIDTNKSAFTPPADRKIVPCLGKNCALPRKIFFLLIPAKAPSPPPSQKHKNIFTHTTHLQPTDRLRTHSAASSHPLLNTGGCPPVSACFSSPSCHMSLLIIDLAKIQRLFQTAKRKGEKQHWGSVPLCLYLYVRSQDNT